MKFRIIFGLVLLSGMCCLGQSKSKHYILPNFKQATLLYKDGSKKTGLLNYNALKKNFVIKKGEDLYELPKADAPRLDTIYIDNRKFIFKDYIFKEFLLDSEDVKLLVEYNCILKTNTEGRNAYGSSSQTTSSTNVWNVDNQGVLLDLKLPDIYSVELKPVYRFTKNGENHEVKTMNQFKKLYKNHKKEFSNYRKKFEPDLYKPGSISKMILYMEGL